MLGQLFDTEAVWRCSGKGWRRDSRLVAVFLGDAPKLLNCQAGCCAEL
jgi:hypothetical protein